MDIQNNIWRPHSGAQEAFHRADAFEIGYGGAAGGGKTESLLRESLRQVNKEGYNAILFRRTYPELELSLVKRAYEVFPSHGGVPHEKGHVWSFPTRDPRRPSRVIFAHLEHDKDTHKYQSAEFDVMGFDEATSFSNYQYTYMRSRVRGSNPRTTKYIMAATNPGNIGHTWYKSRFIDGKEPYKKYFYKSIGEEEILTSPDDPDALSRVFIPAKIWDNPTLIKNNPTYLAQLKSLDEVNRKMLLEGDWDVFQGQFFGEWSRVRHVIRPIPIPTWWRRYVGIDYGGTAPFAVYWIALDGKGNVYVYKEYYEEGKTAEDNAIASFALNADDPYIFAAVDPSVFAKTHIGETIAEVLRRHWKRIVPASNERLAGWNSVRELLSKKLEGDTRPNLYVFENCVNLIRTLPEMIHDASRPEDLNTQLEDHACDALRYVVQTLRRQTSKPPDPPLMNKIKERFRKVFNPNQYYR